MAKTKAKRSVRRKQSAHDKKVTGDRLPAAAGLRQGTAEKARAHPRHAGAFHGSPRRIFDSPPRVSDSGQSGKAKSQFRETAGKRVETVELLTAPDYHTISINFRDKTCLHFSIETGFTVRTDYSDWKTGEQRVPRKWPMIKSKPLAVGG